MTFLTNLFKKKPSLSKKPGDSSSARLSLISKERESFKEEIHKFLVKISNDIEDIIKNHSDEALEDLLEESEFFCVSVNENILKVLEKENIKLGNLSWEDCFSIGRVEGEWPDGTYILSFPLLEEVTKYNSRENEAGDSEESIEILEKLREAHPTFWHVPFECIEPYNNTNAYAMLRF